MSYMSYGWYHGNITRSKAEDLLSQAGKDGSYLVRDSESVCRAYALCVLNQSCVHTYRILQNAEQQLSVQASEGVPMRFFTNLVELIEFYRRENVGLVTHLKYPIEKEEEGPEEPDEEQEPAPPNVPPRNFAFTPVSEIKECQTAIERAPAANASLLLSETFLQRFQDTDSRCIPEEHLQAIRDYFSLHVVSDCDMVRSGSQSLPQFKKLLMTLCTGLHRELTRTLPTLESLQVTFDPQLSPGFRQRSPVSCSSKYPEQNTGCGHALCSIFFPHIPFLLLHNFPSFLLIVVTGLLYYSMYYNLHVEQEAENIIQKIKQQQYQELLAHDQLNLERKENLIFFQFDEEEITFPPTYRFERGSRERYCYTKQKATGIKYNLPSWCDRVLWKSYPHMHILCQSYGCTDDITTSDHSPVFCTFQVGVTSQFVSKNNPGNSGDLEAQGHIELMNCRATLYTKSHTKFYIEFHSPCLENMVKSSEAEDQEGNNGTLVVKFGVLPKLTPIISDLEYLLDQHLLICIKSSDTDESYGEGCIALRKEDTEQQFQFSTILTHHGEETGLFCGEICLLASGGKQREKLYDFVKIEKDETVAQKQLKHPYSQAMEQSRIMKSISEKSAMMARMRGVPVCPSETQNSMDHTASVAAISSQPKQSPPTTPPGFKASEQRQKPGSPVLGRGDTPLTPPPRTTLSNQKFPHPNTTRAPPAARQQDSLRITIPSDPHEMVDNPLYGPINNSLYPPPAQARAQKSPEPMARTIPSIPSIRQRAMTCSSTEKKPVPAEKAQVKSTISAVTNQNICRPEGGPGLLKPRPPVPAKNQSAARDVQNN
eukprot:XP_017949543.1 PREDICTED: phosphatidylinositol 3,4,5-trisphosphate 5-phosphatase 1 [Xenopus tropicalis]